MVSFTDVVGGETGELLNYYALYIAVFLTFGIIYYVGLFRLLYKLVQQAVLVVLMFGIIALWFALSQKHWLYIQDASSVNVVTGRVYNNLFSTNILSNSNNIINDSLNEQDIITPLSEIILISGTTIVLLCWLYRQLPIDLIPDFIPCIGNYDDLLAGLFMFIGILITIFGIYLQLNYVEKPCSSKMASNYFNGLNNRTQNFLTLDTDDQINQVKKLSGDVLASSLKFFILVKQAFVSVAEMIQTALLKEEL